MAKKINMDGIEANPSRVKKLIDKAERNGGIVWFLPDEPKTIRYSVDSEDFDEYPGWDFVDAGLVKIVYQNLKENIETKSSSLSDAVRRILTGTHTQDDLVKVAANGIEEDEAQEDVEVEKEEAPSVRLTKNGSVDGRTRAYKQTINRLKARRQEKGE
tara:strand:+ start:926 stop:1399 length:474 start_codon:yes stop_codon:yes gene_type:complete